MRPPFTLLIRRFSNGCSSLPPAPFPSPSSLAEHSEHSEGQPIEEGHVVRAADQRLTTWRKYIHKIPLTSPFGPLPISLEPLHEKMLEAAWRHSQDTPDRLALILAKDSDKFITFGELYWQSHSIATYLRHLGFGKGKMAAIVLNNSLEWPVVYLGTCASGGAISLASVHLNESELARQLNDSSSVVVFTEESLLDKVLKAIESCPSVKTVVCIRHKSHFRLPANVIDYAEVLRRRPEEIETNVEPYDLALLPYSSGTTGVPKGTMLTHKNFGTMVEILKHHWETEVMHILLKKNECNWSKETTMLHLPMFHIFGMGILNFSLFSGTTGVVLEKFESEVFLKAIQQHKPRFLFVVPPILILLAKHPRVDDFDLSSIEFVETGAAPAGKAICEELIARHPNVKYLAQGYGMTECSMASHLPLLDRKHPYDNVGVICSNFEQKTICHETGEELGPGKVGEIIVRSPTIMRGYLNKTAETEETVDEQGWLHTGDIGYYDEDGRTFIVDRRKELIKVKGMQVAPADLEDLLLSHPLIQEAAVIGLPDMNERRNRGELVRAYVIRKEETLSVEDVIRFVSSRVAEYKHITGGVRFVTVIPKSAAGKILRRVLRDQVREEMKKE